MDDGASGSITREGDSFAVAVNGLESETRQRFTAAHELAHYFLHSDPMADGKQMHHHVDTLYAGGEHSYGVISSALTRSKPTDLQRRS